jgi:hypothetical protein
MTMRTRLSHPAELGVRLTRLMLEHITSVPSLEL